MLATLLLAWALSGPTHGSIVHGPSWEDGLPDEARSIQRVRSQTPAITAVIVDSMARSETMRRLVGKINSTDGLVYVDEGRCGHSVRACLVLSLKVAGPHRLLRILVDTHKTNGDLAASIGHELQHAVEVLDDPGITNFYQMFHFFLREGPTGLERFETAAAVKTGWMIDSELHASRSQD
jgi:hypothetical protein